MKKIILLISIITLLSSVCFAETTTGNNAPQTLSNKTVGIFIVTPTTFKINDPTQNLLIRKASIFFPAKKFSVLTLETTSNAIKSYRPNNRSQNIYSSQYLSHEDIQTIAKELTCDYAFLITINKGLPSMSTSSTYKTSVTCEFRVINVQNGSYMAHKIITKDVSSDNVRDGIPTYGNAYSDALERALFDLNLDVSNL